MVGSSGEGGTFSEERSIQTEVVIKPLEYFFNSDRKCIFNMRSNMRSYSWKGKEVETLWSDLHEGFEGISDVNAWTETDLGQILVVPKEQTKKEIQEQGCVHEVKDGQQP